MLFSHQADTTVKLFLFMVFIVHTLTAHGDCINFWAFPSGNFCPYAVTRSLSRKVLDKSCDLALWCSPSCWICISFRAVFINCYSDFLSFLRSNKFYALLDWCWVPNPLLFSSFLSSSCNSLTSVCCRSFLWQCSSVELFWARYWHLHFIL